MMTQVTNILQQVKICAVTADDAEMAKGIADAIGASMVEFTAQRFANGVPEPMFKESIRGKYLVLVCSVVGDVIWKSWVLTAALAAARDSHVGYVLVAIPYSAFWRSDKKDKGGTAWIAKHEAQKIMQSGADQVLLVDVHNDAVGNAFESPDIATMRYVLLNEAGRFVTIQAMASADGGGAKRTREIAELLDVPHGTTDKNRRGKNDKVDISRIFGVDYAGLCVGVSEDESLTGQTAGRVSEWLQNFAGASKTCIMCVHAPFFYVEGAVDELFSASETLVITTNTVSPPEWILPRLEELKAAGRLYIVDVSPSIGDVVHKIITGESVGAWHGFRAIG